MTSPQRPRTVGVRIAEDLRATIEVLQRDGWSHGAGMHDPDHGHDVTGAIYVATGYHQQDKDGTWVAHPLHRSAGRRSSECLRWLLRFVPSRAVWEWNDQAGSLAEVVDVLERAATEAAQRLREHRDVERLLS